MINASYLLHIIKVQTIIINTTHIQIIYTELLGWRRAYISIFGFEEFIMEKEKFVRNPFGQFDWLINRFCSFWSKSLHPDAPNANNLQIYCRHRLLSNQKSIEQHHLKVEWSTSYPKISPFFITDSYLAKFKWKRWKSGHTHTGTQKKKRWQSEMKWK